MAGTMTGKVALVTGAASGIGRAIALAFAHEGANVVVADIEEKAGKETVGLIEERGAKGLFVRCDVTNGEEVRNMVETSIRELGRLDYACNDAGIHEPLPESLTEVDEDMWDRIIAVNLKGVMLSMKHEVPPMLKQGGGVIVNIASLGGLVAEPGSYAYTASKHGVMGLTKVAAFQYARDRIRINAICPACIDTPMLAMAPQEVRKYLKSLHPIGRFGKPEEIAAAVMWLCSDLSAFVTGTGIVLDGGASTV